MSEEVWTAIGLGSNLGDRVANLRFGFEGLRRLLHGATPSSVYETAPLHVTVQPRFLNACCTGRTRMGPHRLLAELQRLEELAGRRRSARYGPRVLDLDILLYGEQVIDEPSLVVPHPRLRERAFVLIPLREVAKDWRVPGSGGHAGQQVRELADEVPPAEIQPTDIRLEDA